MKNTLQLSKPAIAGIVILLILLVFVRLFEKQLFYDPLLQFFKHEKKILPQYNSMRLFLNLAFRYGLNMLISIGIIYLLFKDAATIRLTAILYTVLFALLIAAFFLVLRADEVNLLLLFYIRRFLIQPLFLLLFVPAYYYQRKMK